MLDLEGPLEVVVKGVVAEGVTFVSFSFFEVLLDDQGAPVTTCSHFELFLPCEQVLVVFPLAGELLLLGREGEQKVLITAVPGA